jgi:hypothetical protein
MASLPPINARGVIGLSAVLIDKSDIAVVLVAVVLKAILPHLVSAFAVARSSGATYDELEIPRNGIEDRT